MGFWVHCDSPITIQLNRAVHYFEMARHLTLTYLTVSWGKAEESCWSCHGSVNFNQSMEWTILFVSDITDFGQVHLVINVGHNYN